MSEIHSIGRVVVVVVLAGNAPSAAGINRDFLADYEQPARSLSHAYDGLRIRMSCTQTLYRDGEVEQFTKRGTLLRSADRYRIDGRYRVHGRWGDATRTIVAVPGRTFIVSRANHDATATLDGWELDYSSQIERMRVNWPIPFAAFCVFERPVLDYLRAADVKIISRFDSEDGSICRIECRRKFQKRGKQIDQRSTFWFLPKMSWALSRYHFGGKTGDAMIVEIDYQGETNDGVPIPSRVLRRRKIDGVHQAVYEAKIEEVANEVQSGSEFDLETLGVSGVGSSKPRRAVGSLAALIAGTGLLAAGAVLWPRPGTMHRRKVCRGRAASG